jgi:hypothetical protein
MMSKSLEIVLALVGGLAIIYASVTLSAQPKEAKKPFETYRSGGNCVYIVDGKYANFIAVVPVGPAGC